MHQREQHTVIRILWAKGVPGAEINQKTFSTIWEKCFAMPEFGMKTDLIPPYWGGGDKKEK
jgi:hypothetical protein